MICDYFRVTGAHDTVLDYADLFSVDLRNDDVQELDTRWDDILLSMSKIPPADILESLYKLRIRESDQLKTVLELYYMKIIQKISMPNYQRLKTMVKRSIDQKLLFRNFDASNERIEPGALATNRRGQRGIERGNGVCYQWKAKVQCSREDSCSFRHDEDKRAKSTPKSERVSEAERSPSGKFARQPCRHYIKGECTRPSCDNGHPTECQFYKTESGCTFGEKCSFVHRQVADQPSKKPKGDGDNNAVALLKDSRQLGCVPQDTEPPESSSFYGRQRKSWNQFDEWNSQKLCHRSE